jgi:tRNA-splicing ligase RtcB
MSWKSKKRQTGGKHKSSSMFEKIRVPSPEIKLRRINPNLWEIPRSGGMRVPARIYANDALMESIRHDKCTEQVANVAYLPGIVKYSLAMPDIHWGYGFPIGGVAATDPKQGGVISPGGVGYDINCGVRVASTHLNIKDVQDRMEDLVKELFRVVPCGTGRGSGLRDGKGVSIEEECELIYEGAAWAVDRGYGVAEDVEFCEEKGRLPQADPRAISTTALERGARQVGSLGSGNHFLEVDVVDKVFDREAADIFGIEEGSVVVQIHCGSRGFGYQVCDDFLDVMQKAVVDYDIKLPDRQLCCVPVDSLEGKRYIAAMACAANFAWVNRQVIMDNARKAFMKVLDISQSQLGWRLIYDVCHNIAKFEDHDVDGQQRNLCVHRKGATRAFPKGHADIPAEYQNIGQPVMVPGDMGTYSFICCGEEGSMFQTFGSSCHGAGRMLSRSAAVRQGKGRSIQKEMAARGITVIAKSHSTLAEEMSEAYKNVEDVVDVVDEAGLARKAVRLRPVGVVKG